jgi:ketosteroid isomerase-like protein
MVLSLHDPDEEGRWYARLSNRLYCTFLRDSDGQVTALEIHEVVRMLRRSDSETIPEGVPAELRPLLGSYRFAALRADFEVLYDQGSLAIHDPTKKKIVHLRPTKEAGRWIDEYDKNRLTFERGEGGAVTALLMDAATRLERRAAAPQAEPQDAVAQVRAMLEDFHRAAAEADAERLFGHIDPEATIFGTDATERWSAEQFRALTAPYLARGQGWTTLPVAQFVHLSEGEDFAWFHERLGSTRHGAMRGSGVARKQEGRWRIVHYDTAFPVPDRIFRDLVQRIAARETTPRAATGAGELTGEAAAAAAVLTAFHRAAGEADTEGLFRHLADDAIVLGTDPTERFDVEQLRARVAPEFEAGQGWTTRPTTQHVFVAGGGHVAWFDERLASPRFGEMRSSGALEKRDGRWQIVHLNFTLPIPNDLVPEFQKLRGKAE